MKKTELILAGIAGISLLLYFLHLPVGIFLAVSGFLLAGLYFYLGFALFNNIRLRNIFKFDSYQGIKSGRILGASLIGIALSSTLIGFLFKVFHLPGADFNLYPGLIGLSLAFIFVLVKYSKEKSKYRKFILLRILIIGLLGILSLFSPRGEMGDPNKHEGKGVESVSHKLE